MEDHVANDSTLLSRAQRLSVGIERDRIERELRWRNTWAAVGEARAESLWTPRSLRYALVPTALLLLVAIGSMLSRPSDRLLISGIAVFLTSLVTAIAYGLGKRAEFERVVRTLRSDDIEVRPRMDRYPFPDPPKRAHYVWLIVMAAIAGLVAAVPFQEGDSGGRGTPVGQTIERRLPPDKAPDTSRNERRAPAQADAAGSSPLVPILISILTLTAISIAVLIRRRRTFEHARTSRGYL